MRFNKAAHTGVVKWEGAVCHFLLISIVNFFVEQVSPIFYRSAWYDSSEVAAIAGLSPGSETYLSTQLPILKWEIHLLFNISNYEFLISNLAKKEYHPCTLCLSFPFQSS